jgi:hypothetical protein
MSERPTEEETTIFSSCDSNNSSFMACTLFLKMPMLFSGCTKGKEKPCQDGNLKQLYSPSGILRRTVKQHIRAATSPFLLVASSLNFYSLRNMSTLKVDNIVSGKSRQYCLQFADNIV